MAILQKFQLLLWKNWLLQWRHKSQTLIEITSPLIFCTFLVALRGLVSPTVQDEPNKYENLFPYNIPVRSAEEPFTWNIAWSPQNKIMQNIMDEALKFPDGIMPPGLPPYNLTQIAFQTAGDLEIYLTQPNPDNTKHTLAGVEFPDHYNVITDLPKCVQFFLRFPGDPRTPHNMAAVSWQTANLFPLLETGIARQPNESDGGMSPGYYKEGFITLQHQISKAIIMKQANKTAEEIPLVTLQRFPYPPFIEDPILGDLKYFFPLIIMLSFVYTCMNTVKVITNEKERQLKEAMKIMGLPNWLHWTAWFLKSFTFLLFSAMLVVLLFKIPFFDKKLCVLPNSDISAVFFYIIIYLIATITFCFMISVFFSKANTAAAVAGLAWFLSYAPFLLVQNNYATTSVYQKLLLCTISNSAMGYGFLIILMQESLGVGLQWGNIFTPVTSADKFHIGHVMIMLIIDSIICLLVTIYVEQIFPGDYGVSRPWYFPCTRSFWGSMQTVDKGDTDSGSFDHQHVSVEPAPEGMTIGVSIRKLRKVFPATGKVAVERLTLDMYENQITLLLGHNGAGKTTTMSMITGMIQPTSGTAFVNGYDIRTQISHVRDSLGFCPQHNILFGELTPRDHLYFFSKLKGLKGRRVNNEVERYLRLMNLKDKENVPCDFLSGGLKRKIAVAIALCGGSKVVFCDEPTAGMDPAARRGLWDLLQAEKRGRSILLTTHFMDEADLLGDRIAIMSGGRLQCVGSSYFLKKKYGFGSQLLLTKSDSCNVNDVTDLLRKHIPKIFVESHIGSELSYRLRDKHSKVFEQMFTELEDNSDELGILSYSYSLPTLGDVFWRAGSEKRVEFLIPEGSDQFYEEGKPLRGCQLTCNQYYAIFVKHFYLAYRSLGLHVIQLILPISFLIIAVTVVRQLSESIDNPRLPLALRHYDQSVTVLSRSKDIENDSAMDKMYHQYMSIFSVLPAEHEFKEIGSVDVEEFILKECKTKLHHVTYTYIVGVSFTPTGINAWFNNQPYHALPLSMNMVHNAILQGFTQSDYKISVSNKPLPVKTDTRLKSLESSSNMGFHLAFNAGFSMAFVSSFYLIVYVRERMNKTKLLQFVSGVEVLSFWIPAFIFDLITFGITALTFVATLAIFQETGFSTFPELVRAFEVLMFFGFCMLPMMYVASFFFTGSATAFVRMSLLNIFLGPACFLTIYILRMEQLDLLHVADALNWIFLLSPHYGISAALNNLNQVAFVKEMCDMMCGMTLVCGQDLCDNEPECCILLKDDPYYSWDYPGVGKIHFFMAMVGFIYMTILLLIEFEILTQLMYVLKNSKIRMKMKTCQINCEKCCENSCVCCKQKIEDARSAQSINKSRDDSLVILPEAPEVNEEAVKINAFTMDEICQYTLVLKNLTKYYDDFLAVKNLCFTVNEECFGLLGQNGAGKTTTFRMLTGDLTISSGDAWVKGMSVKTDLNDINKVIGYCPQYHALFDTLTGRETLKIFCLLRGVRRSDTFFVSDRLADELAFTQHIDKQVRQYSGGNKRKLSTAISLIGDPMVIYLDEPTAGMDIVSKRCFWNSICHVREKGRSIVLTSNSMEECEVLCTRLAVMVNGVFKCIGSPHFLKTKYSAGYTLTIKVLKNEDSPLKRQERLREYLAQGSTSVGSRGSRFKLTPDSPITGNRRTDDESSDDSFSIYESQLSFDRFLARDWSRQSRQIADAAYERKLRVVKNFIEVHIPDATLTEEFQCVVSYDIPLYSMSWSSMFGIIHKAKTELEIEDFTLGHTNMEHVFLQFMSKQRV